MSHLTRAQCLPAFAVGGCRTDDLTVCKAACMPCSTGIIGAPALEHHACCRAVSLGAAGRIGNRQVRRAVARRGVHRRQPLKTGRLITPRVIWPPFEAGLSMEVCGTSPDGVQPFPFVHSTAYRVHPRIATMMADVSQDHLTAGQLGKFVQGTLKVVPDGSQHSSDMCIHGL